MNTPDPSVAAILASQAPAILVALGSLLASATALILGIVNSRAAKRDREEAKATRATAEKALDDTAKLRAKMGMSK